MITRNSLFSVLLACLAGIIAVACNSNDKAQVKVSVDKDVKVAIYSTVERNGMTDTVSPCLLEETVHISELIRYSGDNGITMPFFLADTTKYAEITERNIDKRIAISVNGQVVSTPMVKMRLNNGACSVVLDSAQLAAFFPGVDRGV